MSGKFRDKETGVEGYLRANRYMEYQIEDEKGVPINGSFKTLSELLEKWEEIEEEPKEWWYIDIHGPHKVTNNDEYYQQVKAASKEIGNYFEYKEEAEKAVEKLKAWKRLKDKGFEFKTWGWEKRSGKEFTIWFTIDDYENSTKDLDLLFGGEE